MIEKIKSQIMEATAGREELAVNLLIQSAAASLDVAATADLQLTSCPAKKKMWLKMQKAYALSRAVEAVRQLGLLRPVPVDQKHGGYDAEFDAM